MLKLTGVKKTKDGKRVFTGEHRSQVLAELEKSGLTVSEFGSRNNLSPVVLYRWKRRRNPPAIPFTTHIGQPVLEQYRQEVLDLKKILGEAYVEIRHLRARLFKI